MLTRWKAEDSRKVYAPTYLWRNEVIEEGYPIEDPALLMWFAMVAMVEAGIVRLLLALQPLQQVTIQQFPKKATQLLNRSDGTGSKAPTFSSYHLVHIWRRGRCSNFTARQLSAFRFGIRRRAYSDSFSASAAFAVHTFFLLCGWGLIFICR